MDAQSDVVIQEEIERKTEHLVQLGVPARIFSVQSIDDMGLTTSSFLKKAKKVLQFTVDDLLEKILTIGIKKRFYIHYTSMDLKGFISLVNYLESADGSQEVRTLAATAVFSHQRQLYRSAVKKVQDDYAVRKAELYRQLAKLEQKRTAIAAIAEATDECIGQSEDRVFVPGSC